MNKAEYAAAIDNLERALCARYHVPSLDGVGALGDAIAAARNGDLTAIAEAMDGREMYRWSEPAAAAIAAAEKAMEVPASDGAEAPPEEPSTAVKAISRMNKAELLAEAEKRNLDVTEEWTVEDLRNALHVDDAKNE